MSEKKSSKFSKKTIGERRPRVKKEEKLNIVRKKRNPNADDVSFIKPKFIDDDTNSPRERKYADKNEDRKEKYSDKRQEKVHTLVKRHKDDVNTVSERKYIRKDDRSDYKEERNSSDRKPYAKGGNSRRSNRSEDRGKPAYKGSKSEEAGSDRKYERRTDCPERRDDKDRNPFVKSTDRGAYKQRSTEARAVDRNRYDTKEKHAQHKLIEEKDFKVRLNKYLADAGICSRREADKLIASGVVRVNGEIVTQMGFKVSPEDKIQYGGDTLKREKNVYVLLNKPKDFITTLADTANRRTVFDLIKNICRERVYPVGRLDRNTTGVLLFTNDGELTKKLTHPRYGVRKIYHVELDRPLTHADFTAITEGVELEDGMAKVDEIAYISDTTKREVGVEIHIGRNRIVRRLFEYFGYKVVKLDRVSFAGLTKKNLPRGRTRLLTTEEVSFLKMANI